MEIRKAEPSDAEFIQEVAEQTWKETYIEILGEKAVERIIEDWYDEDSIRKNIEEHDYFYIIEIENAVAGYIDATLEDTVVEVQRLYIYPEYWRQGLGTRIYRELESKVSDTAESIELEILTENDPAASFYRENGFELVKTEEVELKGEKVEQSVMRKQI